MLPALFQQASYVQKLWDTRSTSSGSIANNKTRIGATSAQTIAIRDLYFASRTEASSRRIGGRARKELLVKADLTGFSRKLAVSL